MSSRSCLFCDGSVAGVERAREHVVPDWLRLHLDATNEIVYQATAATNDRSIQQEREHALSAFVEGQVCRLCNNGWMSVLENEAKPILIPLMAGESPLGLNDSDRQVLARWTAKTAYMCASASLFDRTSVPSEHLSALSGNDNWATGVGVFACVLTPYMAFAYAEHNQWPVFSRIIKPEPEGRYKIALQFKALGLLVAHWPEPNAMFVLEAGVHVPVWPPKRIHPAYFAGRSVPQPSATPLSSEATVQLERFSNTLGIILQSL